MCAQAFDADDEVCDEARARRASDCASREFIEGDADVAAALDDGYDDGDGAGGIVPHSALHPAVSGMLSLQSISSVRSMLSLPTLEVGW